MLCAQLNATGLPCGRPACGCARAYKDVFTARPGVNDGVHLSLTPIVFNEFIFVRYLAASLLVFSYLIFCWLCWRNYQRKQNISTSSIMDSDECILIGYASQTGSALHIAQQTAAQLEQAGKPVHILSLNQITPAQLTQVSTALFIVSTYGEGEAPDNGNRFIARTLAQLEKTSLQHLHIAMLALGDKTYQHYCGFAHQLHYKLHQCGAHFLTDIIEVDRSTLA